MNIDELNAFISAGSAALELRRRSRSARVAEVIESNSGGEKRRVGHVL
jgi:hypothetical protein